MARGAAARHGPPRHVVATVRKRCPGAAASQSVQPVNGREEPDW